VASLAEFDARLAHTPRLRRWAVESVDLSNRADALATVDVTGAMFLGCTMPTSLEDDLTTRGALVFPQLPNVPFNPYRAGLYTASELYGAGAYHHSLDGRVYAWFTAQSSVPGVAANLAMSLHDQAIGDAVDDLLGGLDTSRLVGVMGGHQARRDDIAYAAAAQLGAALAAAGFTVATGGGPGAMEAANLGARLGEALLSEGLASLAQVPQFTPDITAWAQAGLAVAATAPAGRISIGIPTWFYGHEPPNVFATHIAKYFSNALREDVLLSRCGGGLVFLPGAAGTVQEIFQCATRNYYAPGDTAGAMVLLGRDYWTRQLPAWHLLAALGEGRPMGLRLRLVDTVAEAVAALD